ncbi:MAG: hypothetical protein ACMV1K_01220 [Sulfurospirillum sp.]|jgi:hypothetical protein
MPQSYEDFDEFIIWLKNDGLKPFKSERIWKKKIFANLINNHIKTLENYYDFLKDKKIKALIGKKTNYQNLNKIICTVEISHNFYTLLLEDRVALKVKIEDIDEFMTKYINLSVCDG